MNSRTLARRVPSRTALSLASLLLVGSVKSQIAAWDFTGESSPATSAADVYNANLDASNLLTRGSGAAASTASNSFRTVGFQNNGISTANTDYFEFTLSATVGYSLNLSTLDARVNGTGSFTAAPGASQQFAYSLDGVNFTLIGSPMITLSGPVNLPQTDLTGIPALQGITDGTTVTFRFYASGQTTTGGWGFTSNAVGQYGLAVGGSVVNNSTSLAFAAASATVAENVGTTPIAVNITNPSPGIATTADLVLTSGSAARIGNYTTQQLVFPANSNASQSVTITVTDNGVSDGNAVLMFQLQNLTGGLGTPTVTPPNTYTLTVLDNDAPPTVSIGSASIAEGNSGTTNVQVAVTMATQPGADVNVQVTDALTGSALSGTDYITVSPATITFTSADTYPNTQYVTVAIAGDTDVEPNETIDLMLGITSGSATLGTSTGTVTITNDDLPTVYINEVDADNPGTDNLEFVELYGAPNLSLTGTVLVFFNGSNDLSYTSFDLDGYSLDANGFFVVGNAAVPGVDLTFPDNILQNGADAVAIYYADGSSFPTNTPVTTTNLIDALVYDTDDADDVGLLVLLNPSQPQINENGSALSASQSMSRVPDGGTLRNTDTYVLQTPTPGATNTNTCDLVLGSESVACATVTPGPGDTYSVSIPYTGSEPGVTVVNNSGSGTVGGDDPAVLVNGTIVVSGITEGTPYSITFTAPCGALVKSGSAPACEPLPLIVINEVDYDNPGTDNAEWIELRNNGSIAYDLNGYKVELVNGSAGGAAVYKTIVLPTFSLAPGAYYVIGNNATIPNINLVETPATDMIQNGAPDAIGLRDASNNLLDAISYEGTSGAPYQEGGGTTLADPGTTAAASASIGRYPDGADTNDNTADWALACVSTPGAANTLGVDTDGDTFLDCLDGCPNDPNKQAPGQCGCGVSDVDTDLDFIADCLDGCPNDPFKVTPGDCGCGNPDTDADGDLVSDCIDGCPNDPLKTSPGQCGCGVPESGDTDGDGLADCVDSCPLVAGQIGSACDDGNACTTGDVLDANCVCTGTFQDTDGDGVCDASDSCPLVAGQIGAACDDGNACTTGDVLDANCVCTGTFQDTDGDGVCDASDNCPLVAGQIGDACDDGNAATINDVLTATCTCEGTVVACTQNEVTLELTTDNNGAQTSWEIVPSGGGAPACSGSGLASNTTISVTCCLADGCYQLRVLDSFGDGMSAGGWVLRDASNRRILDNAGDANWTGSSVQAPDVFCLPMGTDGLTAATCDQETATGSFTLQTEENPAVTAQFGVSNSTSGYQFWIYNPDGSYSRRVFFSHQSPGSSAPSGTPAPLKASFLRLNTLTTNPVPSFTLLNVKVRGRVANVNLEWGAACRLKVDPTANCQLTQLTTTADPVISCGASGLLINGADKIYAVMVPGANKYQFRFTRPGYTRNIATTTRALTLSEWNTNPLQPGLCYDVVVRVSFDAGTTWCAYGSSCQICTTPPPPVNGGNDRALSANTASGLVIYPNPNRDGLLQLRVADLGSDQQTVTVDVVDVLGKRVIALVIPAQGSSLNATLQLNGINAGLYTVNVSAGDKVFTQRLVIQ